jgi:hypothetical protein
MREKYIIGIPILYAVMHLVRGFNTYTTEMSNLEPMKNI